jgi:hypothetical protein
MGVATLEAQILDIFPVQKHQLREFKILGSVKNKRPR